MADEVGPKALENIDPALVILPCRCLQMFAQHVGLDELYGFGPGAVLQMSQCQYHRRPARVDVALFRFPQVQVSQSGVGDA